MTTEVVTTELIAIIGVGAVLLGVMLTSLRGLRSEMQSLRSPMLCPVSPARTSSACPRLSVANPGAGQGGSPRWTGAD